MSECVSKMSGERTVEGTDEKLRPCKSAQPYLKRQARSQGRGGILQQMQAMQHRSRYSSTQGRKEKSLRLSNISGVSSEHVVTAKLPLNRARPVSNPEQSVPNVTSGLGAEWMTTAAAASGGRKRLRFSPPSFHRRGRRREEGREDKSCLFGFFSITLSPLYLSLYLSLSLPLSPFCSRNVIR